MTAEPRRYVIHTSVIVRAMQANHPDSRGAWTFLTHLMTGDVHAVAFDIVIEEASTTLQETEERRLLTQTLNVRQRLGILKDLFNELEQEDRFRWVRFNSLLHAAQRVSERLHVAVSDAACILVARQESLTILVAEQAAWERLTSCIPAVPQLSVLRLSDYT